MQSDRPNILFVMTDQQRFDTIAALGNGRIYTPNMDRLVQRGVAFTNAYSSCPVCVAARYNIRTGRESPKTGFFSNTPPRDGNVEFQCGDYLGKRMKALGYRTFGIGKFHSRPTYEDLGYEVHMHTEENQATTEEHKRDAYTSFLRREHPEFNYIEQPHGERSDMYYVPQTGALPPELTVEAFVAGRAVEQIAADDGRPYFGFVSFIGPHPPCAPPIPYNRMYNPDHMTDPVPGDPETDAADDFLKWMNHAVWAEGIEPPLARKIKARYYGEISYIDHCLGTILDAVDARDDSGNTLICFFSDHGDHLGDHGAWQKEGFFEASCRIPFLVSWPRRLPAGSQCEDLACLTDLFGMATTAAGEPELRDGCDLIGVLEGNASPREYHIGYHKQPGERSFKLMLRRGEWKYIFLANGGRELLFNLAGDPGEQLNRQEADRAVADSMRELATRRVEADGLDEALSNGELRRFSFEPLPRSRVVQMAKWKGVDQFPPQTQEGFEAFVSSEVKSGS